MFTGAKAIMSKGVCRPSHKVSGQTNLLGGRLIGKVSIVLEGAAQVLRKVRYLASVAGACGPAGERDVEATVTAMETLGRRRAVRRRRDVQRMKFTVFVSGIGFFLYNEK